MNVYIFLLTSMGLFLIQLFAYLLIFYIAVRLVGWPIKILMRRMRQIIRRSETI